MNDRFQVSLGLSEAHQDIKSSDHIRNGDRSINFQRKMVKESNSKMYNSRLPAPSMYSVTAGSPVYRSSKMSKSDNRSMPREEQVQEIIELKRALAKTRQDLQKTRSRRQSQDTRSSSDEETYRRDDLGGSMSGSLSGMSAVSNKPCLNRELVAKLRSMTETIKMLSTENVALREENDELLSGRDDKMSIGTENDSSEVSQLKAVIHSYEKQVNQLGDKVKSLENEMENKEKVVAQAPEKDKYKSLARRLKEERNQYKDMVEEKKKEQDELKIEIEKMTEIIGDLRENCGKLQEELLQVRLDSPRRMSEKSVQTQPLTRRASIGGGETQGTRSKITPKRTRSSVSSNSSQSSSQSSPRQNQISRSIELSRPKIRNNNSSSSSSSVPNSPARGPRIVKPVQRSQTSNNIPKCSPSPSPKPSPIHQQHQQNQQQHNHQRNGAASGSHTPIGVSQSPSKIPSLSRIPTPSKSRIPVKPSSAAATVGVSKSKTGSEYQDNDEVLYISEEMVTTSDDNMDVVESRSPAPKIQDRRCSQESHSMEVESAQDDNEDDFPPPPIPEEAPTLEPDFPAPPAPADLEKLSLEAELNTEDPMITTPRTLRRADSMRQRMAARRIQRTWKHFYQELEEKKSDGSNVIQQPISSLHQPEKHQVNDVENSSRVINQEDNVEDAIAGVQAAVLSHGARVATLAAARARGGIYTARPWVAKDNSETESENEDLIENLQGLIRSHSFRLKTLREEEDVFRVGKVSSIRAKFSRRSPDGASDDYLNETDRNV